MAVVTTSGVALAACYLPRAHSVHVGGDFYDAVLLEDGRLGLALGDVDGEGLRAAATIGRMCTRVHA